ncbi:MAG TPA: phospholipid carrier-dependent glycosyltransferase, partial [Abditibacteriaceae bacterium]|nr:phospholipid carrier-dependent glycosyltransferase [Abditibacteriaceae bacterium]
MSTRSSRRAKRLSQNPASNPQTQAPSAPSTSAPNVAAPGVAAPETETPNDAQAKAGTTKRGQAAARSSQSRKTAPTSKTQRGFAPTPSRQTVVPRPPATVEAAPEEQSLLWWKIAGLCVLLIAAALRLWHLDLVPFHHDEGVNGAFLNTLFKKGTYTYNKQDFHGPTLYYFTLVSVYFNTFLFGRPGLNDFSLRVIPALFGVGTVFLTLGLRRHIGAWASLLAAALLAISPGMVYISRYFIHEMQFVFFTLLAVVAMLRLRPRGAWWWPALLSLFVAGLFSVPQVHQGLQSRGIESLSVTRWQFLIVSLGLFFALTKMRPRGSAIWMLVASVSVAMLSGSKETAPISLVALLLAGALTWLLCDFLPSPLSSTRSDRNDEPDNVLSSAESTTQNSIRRYGRRYGRQRRWRIVAIA